MQSFRRKLSLWLFEKTDTILQWNRYVINLVSLAVLLLMIARYGFKHDDDFSAYWILSIRFFYFFYAFNFTFRLALSRNKWSFISIHWLEFLSFLFIVFNGVSYYLFSISQIQKIFNLNLEYHHNLYEFLLLLFLLLLAFVEFIKSLNFINTSKIKPTTLFAGSYILLIMLGTGLLMLPGFNLPYEFLNVYDALFISTSATCITGLSTISIIDYFNFKGQVVILLLFQIGGIGILTFASFFATFIRKGMGIKHQIMMNELFDTDSLSGSLGLLKRILWLMFGIETIGVIMMMFAWSDYPFDSFEQRLFYSIFHTVSAFCNAGFSLFKEGIETHEVHQLYSMQWILIILIFLGSLGFPTLRDIGSLSSLRERVRLPWKKWKTGSRISVYTSLILLAIGTIIYYLLSLQHQQQHPTIIGKITVSVFQSASLRSAGLSNISMSDIALPLALISMFFMFIGGSSSSLAGGIKTSTFMVIVSAIISTIKGRKEAILGRRTISNELIYKAFAVVIFSGNFILILITILAFTEPELSLIHIAFESVSAFTNCGLSMGITEQLSPAGKVILSLAMFAGRVGLLTLAFALSSKDKPNTIHYPKTHIIIG
jgi:Trk-type K+ transport system membrane component